MLAINIAGRPFSYQSPMPARAGTPRYENWHRPHPLWIPAFAGMTSAGAVAFRHT